MQNNTPNPPSQQLLYPPTPQDYADALSQLQRSAQTQIRTPGALTSNLLADALLEYGRRRAANPQSSAGGQASGAGGGSMPPQYAGGTPQPPGRIGVYYGGASGPLSQDGGGP